MHFRLTVTNLQGNVSTRMSSCRSSDTAPRKRPSHRVRSSAARPVDWKETLRTSYLRCLKQKADPDCFVRELPWPLSGQERSCNADQWRSTFVKGLIAAVQSLPVNSSKRPQGIIQVGSELTLSSGSQVVVPLDRGRNLKQGFTDLRGILGPVCSHWVPLMGISSKQTHRITSSDCANIASRQGHPDRLTPAGRCRQWGRDKSRTRTARRGRSVEGTHSVNRCSKSSASVGFWPSGDDRGL